MRRRVIASFSWYEAGLRGLGFWSWHGGGGVVWELGHGDEHVRPEGSEGENDAIWDEG